MSRRAAILTTLSFVPCVLCALLWLRTFSSSMYAYLDPGPFYCQLAFKDSTAEFNFSYGSALMTLSHAPPTYWYADAEGWRLIFYWVHLNEYRGSRPAHSTFAWRSLGFYVHAGPSGTGWSASCHVPFWFLTLVAAVLPARRIVRSRRGATPTSAFPVEQVPPSAV